MAGHDADTLQMVRFRLLGPLQVMRDGTPLALGGARQRAVLAVLLVERGRAISVDEIADRVWRDHPPAGYAATVQAYVFRLREVLEPGRARGEHPCVLVTEPGGYRLDIDPDAVDQVQFERLLASGEDLVGRGQPTAGAADLEAALALWRGPVLADLANYDFVAQLGRRLEELRMRAVESRFDAELALGHHTSAVAELSALAESYPLREHLQAQRILALYRCGRQAEALEALREVRTRMLDELGIEPGAELSDLHQAILNQDDALLPDRPTQAAQHDVSRVPRPTSRAEPPPLSQRLLVVAAVAAVAAVVLTAVVVYVMHRGGSSAALPANSVARIGADGSFHDPVPVGVGPDGVALAGGAAWVANTGADTVSEIDLEKHVVVQTTHVGRAPESLAVRGHDLWVVNSGSASVSRLSLRTDRVVDTVSVGNLPGGIAADKSGIWVVNTGDGTVVRIDPANDVPDRPIPVGLRPDGIAIANGTVWVSNSGDGTVSPIDVRSHVVGSSIAVGAGPAGIVAAEDAVWVSNSLSQTVSRIDPRERRVVQTIRVGDGPRSMVLVKGRLWVSNESEGTLSMIDPTDSVVKQVPTGVVVRGVATDGSSTYVTTRPGPATGHRGGTLHVSSGFLPNTLGIDPSSADTAFLFSAYSLVYDGLVGLRRTGGAAGLTLVPDLAVDLPPPSPDGRSYVFTLRRGIHYSNGDEVRPADIRRGLQQELTVSDEATRLSNIVGAPACIRRKTDCDLSQGVEVDDKTFQVVIHLRIPDPDFLYKLTEPAFATPVGRPGVAATTPRPATGPYMIGEHDDDTFTLVRNPYFEPWSVAAQPEGSPDRIEWTLKPDTADAVHDVLAGDSDVDQRAAEAPDYRTLLVARSEHFHSTFTAWTSYLFLNTHVAPFDSLQVRRAINFAVDRRAVVDLVGGPTSATPTCQVLPPNLPGYRRNCPFTASPGSDGSYRGPDLARARALVARSGTRGMAVTVVSPWDDPPVMATARYITHVLTSLGYRARFTLSQTDNYFSAGNRAQLGIALFAMDYPTASNVFETLRCGADSPGAYCNPTADRLFRRALDTQRTDQVRAGRVWAKLDRTITDDAAWLPVNNPQASVVLSDRVGNYLSNPKYGPLFGQMWVVE